MCSKKLPPVISPPFSIAEALHISFAWCLHEELIMLFWNFRAEGNRSGEGSRRVASLERFTENEILMERRLGGHEDDPADIRLVP